MKWVTTADGFDEIFDRGAPRSHYAPLVGILESFTREDVERRERLQRLALMNHGITFTVTGAEEGLERIFPFDFVPRFHFAEGGDAMCVYEGDVAYDDFDLLDADGPRHRLYLRGGGWDYVRD